MFPTNERKRSGQEFSTRDELTSACPSRICKAVTTHGAWEFGVSHKRHTMLRC